ncbi:hypothetical protein JD969_13620 [Planctomycetota bacterium]|nr:hypothetical protein JD969_13620 [Planctomycetota bacterium]
MKKLRWVVAVSLLGLAALFVGCESQPLDQEYVLRDGYYYYDGWYWYGDDWWPYPPEPDHHEIPAYPIRPAPVVPATPLEPPVSNAAPEEPYGPGNVMEEEPLMPAEPFGGGGGEPASVPETGLSPAGHR